ncbi:MAG TPA: class I SAM-dependent RNA methyltransferase [Gemmatimonadaceae bacterium]|nr:class I SAM-dependent RNA methyltransferase [Gemmatimonadaceae bacterium]
MPTAARAPLEIFGSTAPGLESIAAGELKLLGIRGKQEPGGVSFDGSVAELYRANLWLRTATRVLVRLGAFHASTFYELERRAKKLTWEKFLPPAGTVAVRVTCRKSRLYHSDAVAERVLSAIARVAPPGVVIESAGSVSDSGAERDTLGGGDDDGDASVDTGASGVADPGRGSQLFVVRIVHDQVEISADSSGELLHRRGYRKDVGKAPLRETLAAAMLLASGWKRDETLIDPLCGSGTIPIEAAMLARRIAPGLRREFQFMRWPGFAAAHWAAMLDEARESMTSPADARHEQGDPKLNIIGGDRDSGAVESAVRNAERAGVKRDVSFAVDSLSGSLAKLRESGAERVLVLANPPYGVRVGDERELRDLYAAIGNAVVGKSGWRIGLLTADQALAAQLKLPLRSRFDSRNGGIPVSFLVGG